MAKKKPVEQSNGQYPLIKAYGTFFMWSEDRIAEMINKAIELKAPDDTVFISGKKPITRSGNFWAPTLLDQLNKVVLK